MVEPEVKRPLTEMLGGYGVHANGAVMAEHGAELIPHHLRGIPSARNQGESHVQNSLASGQPSYSRPCEICAVSLRQRIGLRQELPNERVGGLLEGNGEGDRIRIAVIFICPGWRLETGRLELLPDQIEEVRGRVLSNVLSTRQIHIYPIGSGPHREPAAPSLFQRHMALRRIVNP
jgi:hypothetical protein